MKFIDTMRDGERIGGVYLCKSKQSAQTKNGKPYDIVVLQDRTGILDAKIWDPNSQGIEEFSAMDYVEVMGDLVTFQGKLQLNVKRARKAEEGDYNPGDYVPVSQKGIEPMYQELLGYVDSLKNPYLKKLATGFFVEDTEFIKEFKNHSAAKSVHHGFVGGLLEHTIGVTRICSFLADQYEILNRDLLITAAMFHDIGKVAELSDFPGNDYTDEGQLLGHIVIGAEWIGAKIATIEGFPTRLSNELRHCIIAHHGELEFGSPKKPALVEAVALSFADNTDAKMEIFKEALAGTQEGNCQWLGFNRM